MDGAGRTYRLISADSHVNEPGDLWTSRVPERMRERAPRMEHFDQGDAWIIEGVADPINFGMNACAGLEPEEMQGWMRFEDMRRGGWDPAARLGEMDRDGVDAEVLYPTPRLSNAIVAHRDADYHLTMIRAYNDWLYGRFFDAPNRMIEMVFSGMFDRFPELDVVFAEVDFGWVPYVKEQIDNNFHRLDPVSRFGLPRSPGDYIERHFHFGYMTDTFGLRNLGYVGSERVLWSSDYPHISADYPFSWRTIQASLSGASPHDRANILHGNAQRLYGFGEGR